MFNNKVIFVLLIIIVLTILFFEHYISYLLLVVIISSLIYFLGRKSILSLIIITQVIVTGEDLTKYRPLITLISLTILMYYFFSDYGLYTKSYPKIPKSLSKLITFILITLSISTIFSIDFWLSVAAVFRLIVFLLICYLLYSQIKNKQVIYYYISSLFIAVLILGLSMIFEYLQKGVAYYSEGVVLRVAGVYENPNYAGLLLVITIPFTLAFIMFLKNQKPFILGSLYLFLSFQILLLVLADSRASIISVLISTGVLFILGSKKNKIIFISISLIIIIPLLLFTNIIDMVEIYLRLERVGTREMFWNAGIEVISSHLFTGIGADTFDKLFYSLAPSSIADLYKSGTWIVGKPHPHNLFIYFWAENGILGLLSIILFFFTFFYLIVKIIKEKNRIDSRYHVFIVSILSIGLGIFIRSMFEVTGVLTYGFITRDLPFWIVFISLAYIYNEIDKSSNQSLI